MDELPVSVEEIMKYEAGEMPDDEVIDFFQRLVDTGWAWRLQGHYGRTAETLIALGRVVRKPLRAGGRREG
jgi:hypothetical protein